MGASSVCSVKGGANDSAAKACFHHRAANVEQTLRDFFKLGMILGDGIGLSALFESF